MPNADEIYASSGSFMKGDDFVGCDPVQLTIADVEIKEFNRDDGRVQRRAVLSFVETDEKLVLNNTNRLMVQESAGSTQTEQWHGVKITLYGTKATFGNKMYNVIRVEPPAKKSTGKLPKALSSFKKAFDEANPPPHDGVPDEMDEPIPF